MRVPPWLLWFCLLALVFVGELHLTPRFRHNDADLQYLFERADLDTGLILGGLRDAPALRDTLRWWTGTWCGQVPFWRPVSSLFFWAEWRLFGRRYGSYTWTSVLLGVGLAAMVLWALTPLIGDVGAAVVVLRLFVSPARWCDPRMPLEQLVGLWKNQPDLLAGLCVMGAVGLAVRRRWAIALLPAALGVCCKEIGFVAFVLVLTVLLWRRWAQGQTAPWRAVLLTYGVVGGGLLVAHLWTVGVGYRMGSNEAWWERAVVFWGYPAVSELVVGEWWRVALAAVGLLALWSALRRPLVGLLTGIAGALAVIGVQALISGQSWPVAGAVAAEALGSVVRIALWLVAAWVAWREAPKLVLLGVVWALVGAAPTLAAAQVQPHARWLGVVGIGILWAAVVYGSYMVGTEWWQGRRSGRSGNAGSPSGTPPQAAEGCGSAGPKEPVAGHSLSFTGAL